MVVSAPAEVLPLETMVVFVPARSSAGRSAEDTVPSVGQAIESIEYGKSSRDSVVGRVSCAWSAASPVVVPSLEVSVGAGDEVCPGVADGVGAGVSAPGKFSDSTDWSSEIGDRMPSDPAWRRPVTSASA